MYCVCVLPNSAANYTMHLVYAEIQVVSEFCTAEKMAYTLVYMFSLLCISAGSSTCRSEERDGP